MQKLWKYAFFDQFWPFGGPYDFQNFGGSGQISDRGQNTKIKYLIMNFCVEILMWIEQIIKKSPFLGQNSYFTTPCETKQNPESSENA